MGLRGWEEEDESTSKELQGHLKHLPEQQVKPGANVQYYMRQCPTRVFMPSKLF